MQYAVPALGLDPVYTNTSIDFGTADVGPLALGMKSAGANAGYYVMDLSTNLSLARALQQNGVTMKVQLMATGYGQNLLDQPVAKTLGPDVVFGSIWAPVEVHNKATERFQSDLKKYAGYTGIPDIGVYTGYIACDLAILGLKQQGKNPNQSTYADDLRKVGHFNAGSGLGCADTDISVAGYELGADDLHLGDAHSERQVRRGAAEGQQDALLEGQAWSARPSPIPPPHPRRSSDAGAGGEGC